MHHKMKTDRCNTINFIKSNPIDYISISIATPYPSTQMWEYYVKKYNVDVEKITNWNEFCHTKARFFVEDERKESFERKVADLDRYVLWNNYSKNRILMLHRAMLRPSYAWAYIKSFLKGNR